MWSLTKCKIVIQRQVVPIACGEPSQEWIMRRKDKYTSYFLDPMDPQPGASPISIPTPAIVSLHPHNATPGLAYTLEEFGMLCKSFQDYSRIPIDDRSANFIFYMSLLHRKSSYLLCKVLAYFWYISSYLHITRSNIRRHKHSVPRQ